MNGVTTYKNIFSDNDCLYCINFLDDMISIDNVVDMSKSSDDVKNHVYLEDMSTSLLFQDPLSNVFFENSSLQENDIQQIKNTKSIICEKIKNSILSLNSQNKIFENLSADSIKCELLQKINFDGTSYLYEFSKNFDRLKRSESIHFFIFLNTMHENEGGAIHTLEKEKIQPEKGKLVLFSFLDSNIREIEPVLKNSKYIARGWIEN